MNICPIRRRLLKLIGRLIMCWFVAASEGAEDSNEKTSEAEEDDKRTDEVVSCSCMRDDLLNVREQRWKVNECGGGRAWIFEALELLMLLSIQCTAICLGFCKYFENSVVKYMLMMMIKGFVSIVIVLPLAKRVYYFVNWLFGWGSPSSAFPD